ncbi:uncharacterized protein LOC126794322 [Argentina anserina]|uniref:uncharacterized protein LOC126794322 n=1 Tax=Argentina anserina TaxID=57926 RepID=UPI0021765E3E|nr:uncharacterized protein LOC126794322 [Potentilla anserina]
MALTTGGARVLCGSPTTQHPYTSLSSQRHVLSPLSPRRTLHVVSAKRFTSRTGRLDNKSNNRNFKRSKDQEQDPRTAELESLAAENIDDGYFLPKLPGDEPDFWEGEQLDALGFFVEYLWAFGFGFAVIAAIAAAATFNEGATDFKETPAYKDSIQSREFLEEPEGSSPDVFESNPTEVAPSLE